MHQAKLDKLHPTSCVSYRLRRAARLVARAYDRALSETGLRNTQFTLLAALVEEGPKNVTDLGDALGIEGSTLARNLEILRREGLIDIVTSAVDARTKQISITSLGQARFDAALPIWLKTQQSILSETSNAEWLSMINQLAEIETACSKIP